jgi:2-polyprenyl-3-methyl-5-hydroxy-6-metoxy-1,4-benzoquinol methylase
VRLGAGDRESTSGPDYAHRLARLQTTWWKRVLGVQAPYRWNLRRLRLGFTLDIGCGIGRNLVNLDGRAVGVDHNSEAVDIAVNHGLTVFTPDEFQRSQFASPGTFDSLLAAHVIEHLSRPDALELLRTYLPFVRSDGAVVLITPQERGFRSDPSHVDFVDFSALEMICDELGLTVQRSYSFPFPRVFGKVFTYNEFVVLATTGRRV